MRPPPLAAVLLCLAAGPAAGPGTVTGTLRLHAIDSAALHARRTVRVWLPPGYDASAERYDVLYLLDGQNCFDARTAFAGEWQADETLTRLIAAGTVPPVVVVGVDNGGADRLAEYTFDPDRPDGGGHGGGRGADTEAFLLTEVLPLVDRTYRTRTGAAHTLLGGSSLGALEALQVAERHPEAFGRVLAMSPSLWWAGEALLKRLEHDASGLKGVRVWLDVGTAEEPGRDGELDVERVRRLDAAFALQHVEHRTTVQDGARHNEAAWAGRFPAAVTYLLTGS